MAPLPPPHLHPNTTVENCSIWFMHVITLQVYGSLKESVACEQHLTFLSSFGFAKTNTFSIFLAFNACYGSKLVACGPQCNTKVHWWGTGKKGANWISPAESRHIFQPWRLCCSLQTPTHMENMGYKRSHKNAAFGVCRKRTLAFKLNHTGTLFMKFMVSVKMD